MRLDGKTAIVTGAGSGIGRAVAETLAGAGAHVVATDIDGAAAAETAAAAKAAGGSVEARPLDVTDKAAVEAVARRIDDRWGRCDILVNSAGVNIHDRHWRDLDNAEFDQVVSINLNGAFYCTQAVLPMMRARKDGLVIQVSSWAGRYHSYITGPAYGASKFGLTALSANLNIEECVHGIRSCALCPGEVATPILDHRPVPVSAEDRAKMVQPDDMGDLILFIARMPAHVCLNEIVVSPTWNRAYVRQHQG